MGKTKLDTDLDDYFKVINKTLSCVKTWRSSRCGASEIVSK